METQDSAFSAESQVVGQTPVGPRQSRTAISIKQLNNNLSTLTRLGISEIILRALCTVFCIAVLIAATMILSAVNEVEDHFNKLGSEYVRADSYEKAARWLLLVSVAANIFHLLMTIIRCLYLNSCAKSLFTVYAYLNAALCVVFGLSLFAGGVANAIYAANNAEAIEDISSTCADQSSDTTNDICNAFKRVRDSEAAAASMSFITMVIFAILMIIMISSGVIKSQEAEGQSNDSSSLTTNDTANSPLNLSSYMPLNPPLYTQIEAPPPYTP